MDKSAGETFCEHLDFAYRVALSAARNAADAEDAVQEAYLRFVRGWGSFDRSRPVRPYLAGAVLHAATDRARSEQRRSAREKMTSREVDMEPSTPCNEEALAALRRALPRLEADQRVAVSLHYMEGLTFDELADSLAVPRSTARNRVERGIEELRRILSAAGFGALSAEAALAVMPKAAAPASLKAALSTLVAGKSATTTSPAPAGQGGIIMKIGLGVAAVGLVAGGVFWAVGSRSGEPAAAPVPATTVTAPAAGDVQTPNTFNLPMSVKLGEVTIEPWAGSSSQRYGGWQPGPRLQAVLLGQDRGGPGLDDDGNLYYPLCSHNKVGVITPTEVKWLAGSGIRGNRGDGPAERAQFNLGTYNSMNTCAATGRPLAGKGAVFLADGGNDVVWKIYRKDDGRWWCERAVGGGEKVLKEGEKAPARDIKISVQSVAVDFKGEYLYAAGGSFVRVSLADGTAECLPRIPDTSARLGYISMPSLKLACDAEGNVYGMDRGQDGNHIRYMVKTGKYERLTGPMTWAKAGNDSMKDGPASGATFWCPSVLAVDPKGFIYCGGGDELYIRRVKDGVCETLQNDGKFAVHNSKTRKAACYDGVGGAAPAIVDREGRLYSVAGRDGQVWRLTFPESMR